VLGVTTAGVGWDFLFKALWQAVGKP
jgi:hypothetical protein